MTIKIYHNEYSRFNKEVKKNATNDKKQCREEQADKGEQTAYNGDMRTYQTTKTLRRQHQNSTTNVKSKEWTLLTRKEDQLNRCEEHFNEVLNRDSPHDLHTLGEVGVQSLDTNTAETYEDENIYATKKPKKQESSRD